MSKSEEDQEAEVMDEGTAMDMEPHFARDEESLASPAKACDEDADDDDDDKKLLQWMDSIKIARAGSRIIKPRGQPSD